MIEAEQRRLWISRQFKQERGAGPMADYIAGDVELAVLAVVNFCVTLIPQPVSKADAIATIKDRWVSYRKDMTIEHSTRRGNAQDIQQLQQIGSLT